jgi:predicted transcriptional regulator
MIAKARLIELDRDTADRLEAWARERGLTVAELLAELAAGESALSPDWDSMRKTGRGPWAPEVLAEDARRVASYERTGEGVPWAEVESWIESWGTSKELPPPKPRKL